MTAQEDREAALAQVAARAEEARRDPAKFISFVMKPATEGDDAVEFFDPEDPLALLKVTPHQRVLIEFVLYHQASVVMLPADHAKTTTLAGLLLWMIARDPKLRILLVSATEEQAQATLKVISDTILYSERFHAVAPGIRKGTRPGDIWSDTSITVDRPYGIRDPTVRAMGIDSKGIPGRRIDMLVADDVSNRDNVNTDEQRRKVLTTWYGSVWPRVVPTGKRIVLNTAMDPADLPNSLKDRGVPTLRMDILGNVWVYPNATSHPAMVADDLTDFGFEGRPGASELRDVGPKDFWPTGGEPHAMRLTGNDHEPVGRRTLWPDRYDERGVERLRKNPEFDKLYMNLARNDATQMCKVEYVQTCLRVARELGVTSFADRYDPNKGLGHQKTLGGWTFTGVDLAFSQKDAADDTAFVTFAVLPSGLRLVLDIEFGKFPVSTIVRKIYEKHLAYDSIVVVENNAAQDTVRQWALEHEYRDPQGVLHKGINFPIEGYTTGRQKAHPEYGVPGFFIEMSNGAWAFPNRLGDMHPGLERLCRASLYYKPSEHTDDVLMAMYVAREWAKKYGVPEPPGTVRRAIGITQR